SPPDARRTRSAEAPPTAGPLSPTSEPSRGIREEGSAGGTARSASRKTRQRGRPRREATGIEGPEAGGQPARGEETEAARPVKPRPRGQRTTPGRTRGSPRGRGTVRGRVRIPENEARRSGTEPPPASTSCARRSTPGTEREDPPSRTGSLRTRAR